LPFETSLSGVSAAGDVRYGSLKRVAGAVGEGSVTVGSVHHHLSMLVDVGLAQIDGVLGPKPAETNGWTIAA
jgi:hypothetical protein